MAGESVTGGRLNLFKALTALEQYDTTSTEISNVKRQTSGFKLSPNPVSDVLMISSSEEAQNIKIYSILGELIYSNIISGTTKIDVSQIEAGLYFVIISNGQREETQRVVITR